VIPLDSPVLTDFDERFEEQDDFMKALYIGRIYEMMGRVPVTEKNTMFSRVNL
jgi:hypothetical protein